MNEKLIAKVKKSDITGYKLSKKWDPIHDDQRAADRKKWHKQKKQRKQSCAWQGQWIAAYLIS